MVVFAYETHPKKHFLFKTFTFVLRFVPKLIYPQSVPTFNFGLIARMLSSISIYRGQGNCTNATVAISGRAFVLRFSL